MSKLGQMGLVDLGGTMDATNALNWLEKAAELGCADAMYILGEFYSRIIWPFNDVNKSLEYLEKAA